MAQNMFMCKAGVFLEQWNKFVQILVLMPPIIWHRIKFKPIGIKFMVLTFKKAHNFYSEMHALILLRL